MKVTVSKETTSKLAVSLLLLLIEDHEECYKLDKTNSVSYDLRTVPADADSPKYKKQVRVLVGTESVRAMLKWRQDVDAVCDGLNVTTLETKVPVVETLMRAGPLSLFRQSLDAEAQVAYDTAVAAAPAGNCAAIITAGVDPHRDVAHVAHAIDFVLSQSMPRNVLARVKRQVCREMRKPRDMKVRFYYQQLLRINTEEVARLPPFRANQALGDEELLDVILFGTPKSWQKEMDRQGYDPMNHPLHEVVDFLENVESAEEFDHSKDSKKANTKSSKTKKESGRQGAYCMLHGQGNHSTEDCIKLKAEASA